MTDTPPCDESLVAIGGASGDTSPEPPEPGGAVFEMDDESSDHELQGPYETLRGAEAEDIGAEDAGRDGDDGEGESDIVDEPKRPFWVEVPALILIALIIAILVKVFLVQVFSIPSGSMRTTLEVGDRVLVSKLSYRFGDLERGDVVVFRDPSASEVNESLPQAVFRNILESVGAHTPRSHLIKRVIGLPGETLMIRGDVVSIDGFPIDETAYINPTSNMPDFGPIEIPDGYIFVMGDNRNGSSDSRRFGPVPIEAVVGRGISVIWPPGDWSGL